MEKFKRFTDRATGVNPFTPRFTSSTFTRFLNGFFLPIRLVFGAVVFALLLLVTPFCSLLRSIGLASLSVVLPGPLMVYLNRALLAIMFHVQISKSWYPVKPSGSAFDFDTSAAGEGTAAGKKQPKPTDDVTGTPKPGDVIVANLQSPLDCLAIEALYPTGTAAFHYVFPIFEKGDDGVVTLKPLVKYGKVAAMNHIFAGCPGTLQHKQIEEGLSAGGGITSLNFDVSGLQDIAKKQGAVLVLFAEGTTTNGRGMLQLPSIRCESKLHLLGLQYTDPNAALPLPSDFFSFSYRCTSGLLAGMFSALIQCRVSVIRPSSIPPPQSVFSPLWSEEVRTILCKGISAKDRAMQCLALQSGSLVEKQAFYEHWKQTMTPKE